MKKILILLSFFFIFSLFLFSLEKYDGISTYSIKPLSYNKSEHYNAFRKALKENKSKEEILSIFTEWEKEKDGDYYLNYYQFMTILSYNYKDYPTVRIHPNDAFSVFYPLEDDHNNFYFVYKDHSIHFPDFLDAKEIIDEGIGLYTNRFDLWDALISAMEEAYLYYDEAVIIGSLIDLADYMYENEEEWYVEFNRPLLSCTKYTSFDSLFLDYIKLKVDKMIEDYPDFLSARLIYKRLLESYPNTSFIYNEIGITYLEEDPSLSLPYFEKAYELDKNSLSSCINATTASFLIQDENTFTKYEKIIKESGNKDIIKQFNENLATLLQAVSYE